MGGEFSCTAVEIRLRRRLDSENSRSHLGNVQIHLHDPLLAPEQLDQKCIISLESFPPPASASESEAVLSNLLAHRAAAADLLAFGLMFTLHLPEFLQIKAVMFHELPVL